MVEMCCTIPGHKSFKGANRITFWESGQLASLLRGREESDLRTIINKLGELSAIAQQLRSPITSFDRLLFGSHKLYLLTSNIEGKPNHILAKGILKVGQKNLFIRKDSGHLVEIAPLCVLDFYVHESCQRQGLGHQLFGAMLECENKRACQLGYDRPSNKLLSFLSKHYGLNNYISQANNYVVYNDYFEHADIEVQKKENCEEKPNPEMISRKEKVLHGRRAYSQAADIDQYSFSCSDSNQLTNIDIYPYTTLGAQLQPSYHRGRRSIHWASKQMPDGTKSAGSVSLHQLDPQTAHSVSPERADSMRLSRHNLQGQGKAAKSRRRTNTQVSESRKKNEYSEALVPCNNLYDHYEETSHRLPAYDYVDESDRVKVEHLCYPPKDLLQTELSQIFGTHNNVNAKPQVLGYPPPNQTQKSAQREPPPLVYPFWTEARELSGSHLHDNSAIGYSKTRACYQERLVGHNPMVAPGLNRIII